MMIRAIAEVHLHSLCTLYFV